MCGICGVFDRSGKPVNPAAVRRMATALAHRGPDGEGFAFEGEIAFGHRRLSIIDVDGGSQPIANEDGRIKVVFNGEIYNFVELRAELTGLGHRFSTLSDTEVIVHGYEQWGRGCLNHFNGMFAFALFDARDRSVFLARDHLGVKPLYFAEIGDQLVFASEVAPLLQHPEFRREVDLASLAELLSFRCVPSPKTLFDGIFRLPPGHWMHATRSGLEIQRYWNSIPVHRTRWREEDLIEEYQTLVEDAVRLQMRSDVPLGLFLSSGVDSGALLALMSRHTTQPVQTFTIGFEGGGRRNEVDDAAEMSLRFGAEHHSMILTHRDYASYFERYMSDLEEPVAHEPAPAFYYLSKLTGSRVKVALTGQGADEPWAGYSRYFGVKLSAAYCRLPAALTGGAANLIGKIPFPMERLKRGAMSLAEPDVLTRFSKIYSFFSAEMKARLYEGRLKERFEQDHHGTREALRRLQSEVKHLDPLSQMLYIDTRSSLPDDLLMVADKTSMANSLEVRVPFLDRRVVEFVESLPPSLKLSGWTGKYLHKKAMTRWLPREVVYRKKKGFAHPIADWLRGPLKPLVDDCLLSNHSHMPRYFDQDYIRQLVKANQQGTQSLMRHIYLLVSLELWHRAFLTE